MIKVELFGGPMCGERSVVRPGRKMEIVVRTDDQAYRPSQLRGIYRPALTEKEVARLVDLDVVVPLYWHGKGD